jgi:hypothetical protein
MGGVYRCAHRAATRRSLHLMPAPNPSHRRVVIEFEATARPVTGVIRERGWSPRRFSGWLELIASLDTSRPEADGDHLAGIKRNKEKTK